MAPPYTTKKNWNFVPTGLESVAELISKRNLSMHLNTWQA